MKNTPSERSDISMLIPFLNILELNLRRKYLKLISDASYESEENYDYLENHNIVLKKEGII